VSADQILYELGQLEKREPRQLPKLGTHDAKQRCHDHDHDRYEAALSNTVEFLRHAAEYSADE
jgi:hypothetical protein